MGEGTKHTPPAVPVAAGVGFVEPWVVELLLCAMCQRAAEPKRASSQVVCVRSIPRQRLEHADGTNHLCSCIRCSLHPYTQA